MLILALILAPLIAEKLRLPGMVGLVLAGMALGPHGSGVLASKQIALSSLGEFGLLYLMFSAGLELDLKLFVKMKKAAITFALSSFAIPFTLGVLSARMLHYQWAAAVLMGSNWGSHTLVTYPLLRSMGLARNRAVSTVVGATAVTDTSALLVLAVVSGTVKATGSLGPSWAAWPSIWRCWSPGRCWCFPTSGGGSSPGWGPTAPTGSCSAWAPSWWAASSRRRAASTRLWARSSPAWG